MKADLIEHLKTLSNLDVDLEQMYGIKVRHFGDFVLLDYDQINSPRKHPIVDQCRGVVIHKPTMTYARRMFDRFYNAGEYPEVEAAFDWSTAVADSKEDGSIIGVWYNKFDNRWEIGTRGNAIGDNTLTNLVGEVSSITFRELFIRALKQCDHHDFDSFCHAIDLAAGKDHTLMFELCTLENKTVVTHSVDKIVLLGIRHNETGVEWSPEKLDEITWFLDVQRPKRYSLTSFKEAVDTANSLPNLEEGFVLRDGNNNRLKVKSVQYVAAHHLKGEGMTPKRALLIALAKEVDEFVTYFPEYESYLRKYETNINDLRTEVTEVFAPLKDIIDQKEFALSATKHKYSGILFGLRKGKTFNQILDDASVDYKLKLFGFKE